MDALEEDLLNAYLGDAVIREALGSQAPDIPHGLNQCAWFDRSRSLSDGRPGQPERSPLRSTRNT